jgi:transcription elongation factor GreA
MGEAPGDPDPVAPALGPATNEAAMLGAGVDGGADGDGAPWTVHAASRTASPGTSGRARRRAKVPSGMMRTIRRVAPRDPAPFFPERSPVPQDRSAPSLLRAVGLLPDGPGQWGRPIRATGSGVFVIELPEPLAAAPLDLARIGRWLERVPALHLDGHRPTGRELATRIGSFWLPEESVLFIGSTPGSVAGRVAAVARTALGERRPASSGHWLHTLADPSALRVWWAATDAVEEYEDALFGAFADRVSAAERASLPDPSVVLPWANLRSVTGERKATGITEALLPDDRPPGPAPVTAVVELPPAEADGARDEAKRGRRPAPGRGAGRVASAAAYAAQGSPRKVEEPVYLSPEGKARLEAELHELVTLRRPEVVKRIATAREHGDLKENAEYHAAREEQSFLEGRIRSLEARLKVAVIVAPEARGASVEVGSRVRVEHDGEELLLTIVGSSEADADAGRISNVSPVGRALIARRVGDVVTVKTPGGDRRYEVLAIE